METKVEFNDRLLSLGLARVSEAAAIAAARFIGSGDEKRADQAAVDAMRAQLNLLDINGVVVIGEGDPITVGAEPVSNVVDTTGAGDQYAAGFLYGISRGLPLATCAHLGHIAAAEVISHFGPRPEKSYKELAEAAGIYA